MKSEKQGFLSKHSAPLSSILTILSILAIVGGAWGTLNSKFNEKIKKQVIECQVEYKRDSDAKREQLKADMKESHKLLTNRLLKIECGLYVKMNSRERAAANELYEQLGGR